MRDPVLYGYPIFLLPCGEEGESSSAKARGTEVTSGRLPNGHACQKRRGGAAAFWIGQRGNLMAAAFVRFIIFVDDEFTYCSAVEGVVVAGIVSWRW